MYYRYILKSDVRAGLRSTPGKRVWLTPSWVRIPLILPSELLECRMKQIMECLDRVFLTQKPLKKKWKAYLDFNENGEQMIILYHYQHLILVSNITTKKIMFAWYEKDADKRGLLSAIKYLVNNGMMINNRGNLNNIYNILLQTTDKFRAMTFVKEYLS